MFGGGRSDLDSKRDDLSDFNMSDHHMDVGKGLRFRDTISELYDETEKQAVFNSNMKKGGAVHDYNATFKNASPEQMYNNF